MKSLKDNPVDIITPKVKSITIAKGGVNLLTMMHCEIEDPPANLLNSTNKMWFDDWIAYKGEPAISHKVYVTVNSLTLVIGAPNPDTYALGGSIDVPQDIYPVQGKAYTVDAFVIVSDKTEPAGETLPVLVTSIP